MIIDAHVHVSRAGFGGTHPKLLSEMKLAKISKSIVLDQSEEKTGYSRQQMIDIVSRHKNLELAGTFDMLKGNAKDISFLDKHLKKRNYIAVKLYPGYQHFFPSERKCDKIYKLCIKHDVPVIFHSGGVWDPKKSALLKYSIPVHIDEVAVRFPKLKIVMAHLGCPYFDHAKEILNKNDNVFADLSGLHVGPIAGKYVEHIRREVNFVIHYVDESIYDRLLFGTDFNLVNPGEYVRFVKTLDIPKSKLPLVFYKNAKRLFNI
jgi:predicted TIM-barrel fold metal-dependent hydrolase